MRPEDPEDGSWAALVKADEARNAGIPIDLLSASGYAEREGISREDYIIRVLRAERDRRQQEDAIASDRILLDDVIDGARDAGLPVVEFILSDRFPARANRTWDISPDFLAKIIGRLEERAAKTGDDGLTDTERSEYAARFSQGVGSKYLKGEKS